MLKRIVVLILFILCFILIFKILNVKEGGRRRRRRRRDNQVIADASKGAEAAGIYTRTGFLKADLKKDLTDLAYGNQRLNTNWFVKDKLEGINFDFEGAAATLEGIVVEE
tara:strand:- start:538 stop:867 length:330 start_codon:yes stop_codon:yes gene_type:complete